jgi:hypothetical protein
VLAEFKKDSDAVEREEIGVANKIIAEMKKSEDEGGIQSVELLKTELAEIQPEADGEILEIEAALNATSGIAGRKSNKTKQDSKPLPPLHLSVDRFRESASVWAVGVRDTSAAFLFAHSTDQNSLKDKFVSLAVMKEISDDLDEESDVACEYTQWIHWDDVRTREGRLIVLDKENRIVYKKPESKRKLGALFDAHIAKHVLKNSSCRAPLCGRYN